MKLEMFRTVIAETDKVLSSGRWPDGTELTMEDVDWLGNLVEKIRRALWPA